MPNIYACLRRSSFILFPFLSFIWVYPTYGASPTIEALNQSRGLMQARQWGTAEKLLQKSLDAKPSKNLELLYFQLGSSQMKQEKWDQAQDSFQHSFDYSENLKEYTSFYLAQIAEKKQETALAEKLYRQVDQLSPNFSLKIEAQKNLASLLLAKNDYRSVRQILAPLEKRSRGTESYPDLIFVLAQAEVGLKDRNGACKLLRKLYSRYPNFEKIKDWSADLSGNSFLSHPTQCSNSMSEFKDRVRSLLWLGNDQKALTEIQFIRDRNQDQEPYSADSILAQYHLQEGEVQKAYDILKGHFKTMKNNFDYLLLYATAAARAGDNTSAVGAYFQAYQLSPRSTSGRKALYQSAFLSYQFQDYDGAYRKFQEFIRKYSSSGLAKDAEWHLAWLKYLKNDYSGAFKSFARLQKAGHGRHRASSQKERNQYWMAMCLLKQGRSEAAKNIFDKLSQDKLMGYYSMAAQARAKQIVLQQQSEGKLKLTVRERPQRIDRFNMNEFMTATDDMAVGGESEESEDNVQLSSIMTDAAPVIKEESEETDVAEAAAAETTEKAATEGTPSVSVADPDQDDSRVTDFKNPLLAQRFQKARDLQILGLEDWAKWDLYEIEKKTRNKEYLKTLMTEYSNLRNFHRSAFIAQTYFSLARESYGIEGIKFVWQEAFPQAFSEDVREQSKKFDVPEGLIWGIMRAESHYRQDAISPVGALGLMQVMPSTAHKMADKIGIKDFQSSQLLTPAMAIQVGTGYLQRLMKKFNRSTPLVAAAYNAGPHRVYAWLSSFGQLQMDEFIEHIPFLETRNYVKKVVTNQQTYSQLYGFSQNLIPMLSESIQVAIPDRIPAKESWEDI